MDRKKSLLLLLFGILILHLITDIKAIDILFYAAIIFLINYLIIKKWKFHTFNGTIKRQITKIFNYILRRIICKYTAYFGNLFKD